MLVRDMPVVEYRPVSTRDAEIWEYPSRPFYAYLGPKAGMGPWGEEVLVCLNPNVREGPWCRVPKSWVKVIRRV